MSEGQLLTFTVKGKPIPKQSTNFGKGKAYASKVVKQHEKTVGQLGRQAAHDAAVAIPLEPNYHVALTFHGSNPLADIDNLSKCVLDALENYGLITNDKLVMGLNLLRNPYPTDNPRSIITIKSIGE